MKRLLPVVALLLSVYSSIAQTNDTQISKSGMKKSAVQIEQKKALFPLAGTWMLKAAETILPDGTQTTDSAYGENAKGILLIDGDGQYSLQIFRPNRPKFTSGDKRRGTPEEYASALLGISTHIGHIKMDAQNNTLQFNIDYAAYPNWDHTTQIRKFKLTGDELYYEVPSKAAGGTVPVSIWTRVKTK